MYSNHYDEMDYHKCVGFMNNTLLFGEFMQKACDTWNFTMLNHLTNPNINRVAFLGQAAACLSMGFPCELTKKAWKNIDSGKQLKANKISYTIIYEWIQKQKLKSTLINGKIGVTEMEYQTKLNLL